MAISTLWYDGFYQLLLGVLCRLSFHAVTGSWCATLKEYLLNPSVKYLGLSDMFFFSYVSTLYPFLFSPSWSLASNNVSFVPFLYFILTSTILEREWDSVVVNTHGFCKGPEISSWRYAKHLTTTCNSAKSESNVPGFWGTCIHVHSLQTRTYIHAHTHMNTHTQRIKSNENKF